jgi:hypothetical protein
MSYNTNLRGGFSLFLKGEVSKGGGSLPYKMPEVDRPLCPPLKPPLTNLHIMFEDILLYV